MNRIKVAITSAGAGPGIAVIKALKRQNEIPLEIIALDMDITAAGLYIADDYAVIPPANDDRFVNFLIEYCRMKRIDFIIPIFDIETPIFAKNKEKFKRECNVNILVNDFDIVTICNAKDKTYSYCIENEILVPKIYSHKEIENRLLSFPLILKPKLGIGSKGTIKINTEKELKSILPLQDDFFLQVFIEGVEYTIDSISDFHGNYLACVPRERIVVKAGQTVKGRSVFDLNLIEYGKKITEIFRIKGPGCLQCKVKDNKIYFIEMNPRYGTGVSLSIAAGINIPLIHLKLALNRKITEDELKFEDNCIMTRYWEEIFLRGDQIKSRGIK